ncbi:MAG: prepilin-type N-terminal cleavage/methylation domain-containing protein [Candidatus Paceibacterota bacterium]
MKKAGFSLIEMVVYIAIAAGILAASVNSISSLMKSFNSARVTSKINNSAEAGMERMTREIRTAYGVNSSSVLDSSPGRLKLDTYNASGATTTLEFYLNNGVLMVVEGGGAENPLTLNGVSVSNLVFYQIANATTSKAVKVEVIINGKNFYDTAILRNSY